MKLKPLVSVSLFPLAALACKVSVDAIATPPDAGDGLGCTTNGECIDANGGRPFVCNKSTRNCVNLQADLGEGNDAAGYAPCTPYADVADFRNDDTIWVGLVIDTKSPRGQNNGPAYVNFAELARREIMQRTGGIPAATAGGKTRPLGLVHCESNGDAVTAVNAAAYLADTAGIQLFIAGDDPTTAVPIEQQTLLPRRLLNVSPVQGGVADLPPSDPPLYYAMNADVAKLVTVYPPQIRAVENDLRARLGKAPADSVRFLLLVRDDSTSRGAAEQIKSTLLVNGKSLADNGPDVRVIVYSSTASTADLNEVVAQAVSYAPELVAAIGSSELGDVLVPEMDRALAEKSVAPSYHLTASALSTGLFTAAAVRPDLQGRLFVTSPKYSTPAVQLEAAEYAAAFPAAASIDTTISGFTMIPYDSVYLLAYAIAANGSNPVTGEAISKQLSKLFTAGATAITASPNDLFLGFQALGAGGSGTILLRGNEAFRGGEDHVELDLSAGKHSYWPVALYCPLSNEAAGSPLPSFPPFAMISLQPTGVESAYPDYSVPNLTISSACHRFTPAASPDGGTADGG